MNSNVSDDGDVKLEPYEIYDQFPCESCGKIFDNQKTLAEHVYNIHKIHISTCDICGKTFKNHKTLSNHMRLHKTINCDSCGKSFKVVYYTRHKANL